MMIPELEGSLAVVDQNVTIYEVARRAGVSISTVSLAINRPDRVKQETRARILAMADEVGFVPKERAVARARAGVGRIAMVAPFSSYPSFSRIMVGVLEELGDDATQLSVVDNEDVATSTSPYLETIPVRGHVDGVLISGVPVEERVVDRLANRLPAVLMGVRHPRLPSIWVNDFAAGQLAGAKLRAWGHQRVGYVRETEVSFLADSPAQQRVDGLRSVMGSENVVEVAVSRSESAGAEAVAALWGEEQSDPPTAVVAFRDLIALGIISTLIQAGFRVPEDISVIGFDDDPAAAAVGLSTILNPFEELGRQAVKALKHKLTHPHAEPIDLELPVMFRDRRTAGPAATK